ncbi:MAG: DUF6428 family protein [Granulosicoccus sp.]
MENTEIGELMAVLVDKPDIPLKFYLEGSSINQGYHVTEVKHASIKSMDCGKHEHSWDEVLIQLLDGKAHSYQGYMRTSRFLNIIRTAFKSLPENSDPRLFFEFSPNDGPLLKLKIMSMDCNDEALSLHLSYEKAICKPVQRWGLAGSVWWTISERLSNTAGRARSTTCCT